MHEIHVHTNTCAHIQENMQAEEASWEEKEWELEEGKRKAGDYYVPYTIYF